MNDRPLKIGFFLAPQFSMIAFSSAIEPLRLANRAAGRPLYEWRLYAADRALACASNGVAVEAEPLSQLAPGLDVAMVCAGIDVQNFDHRALIAALRRLAAAGATIGAVCTGSYILAKAGLLNGYRCTIHWENHQSLLNDFPELEISQELFEIDRARMTCAGGTAAVDMMLSMIAGDHGADIAGHVVDQLIHHRIRRADERQRMDLKTRLGATHPGLLAAIVAMEETIDAPVSCAQIARRAGLSSRQMERLFQRYLGATPSQRYLSIRLDRARLLLRQTSSPVLSVALTCGFASAAHFSRAYAAQFGVAPRADRGRSPSDRRAK